MSQLVEISGCNNAMRKADVLYVHGLGGNAHTTWCSRIDNSASWPHWLGEDFPEIGIWLLDYAASPTNRPWLQRLLGQNNNSAHHTMALPDRALQVQNLLSQRGFGQRPIMFICHSMGGLLVKQLLRKANDSKRSILKNVALKTRAVLFLSTPHSGAWLASLADAYRGIFGTTINIEELKEHHAHLRDLFEWYRSNAKELGIETLSYYEVKSFKGIIPIVNPTSAHPGIGDAPIGLDEDHVSISRPQNRDAQVYRAASDLLQNRLLEEISHAADVNKRKARLKESANECGKKDSSNSIDSYSNIDTLNDHDGDILRVSIAAIIKFEQNEKFLLVRNLHRQDQNLYSPFGGVFKYFHTASTDLDDMGFCPQSKSHKRDLGRDLRGYLPRENFPAFQHWFRSQIGRELPEACLKRELREELSEISAPSFLIENVSSLTFQYIWTVIEPETKIPEGCYQYRQIEVYELAFADPVNENANRKYIKTLFELLYDNEGAMIVDYTVIGDKNKIENKKISNTTNYLISSKDHIPDSPLFGRAFPNTEADKYVLNFLRSGQSKFISVGQNISRPVVIHQVKKRYSPSLVARFKIDRISCVLKYYPNSNRYAQKEDWALRALSENTTCNVSKIIESDIESEMGPAFLILKRVNGKSLSEYNPDDRVEHLPSIIQQVLHLREITFPKYGEIVGIYEPVANQSDLMEYVIKMVIHWQETLKNLPSRQKTIGGIAKILSWADSISAENGGSKVWSALSEKPCLCHSDLKPQDILIENNEIGSKQPVLLDFDNIFAFIPEYDLCKFHMYLITQRTEISLEDFSLIIANGTIEKQSKLMIQESLKSTYPYVLTRLLHWAVPRNAEGTIDLVATVSKIVDIQV